MEMHASVLIPLEWTWGGSPLLSSGSDVVRSAEMVLAEPHITFYPPKEHFQLLLHLFLFA